MNETEGDYLSIRRLPVCCYPLLIHVGSLHVEIICCCDEGLAIIWPDALRPVS